LRGLWRSLEISEAEIAEAKNEMWGNFPKEPRFQEKITQETQKAQKAQKDAILSHL